LPSVAWKLTQSSLLSNLSFSLLIDIKSPDAKASGLFHGPSKIEEARNLFNLVLSNSQHSMPSQDLL